MVGRHNLSASNHAQSMDFISLFVTSFFYTNPSIIFYLSWQY